MNLISLDHVTYTYPLEHEPALNHFNFTFEKGKVYGVIGANEAGKTTLCNIIRGFIPAIYKGKLTGQVMLKNKPLADYEQGDLAEILGYSFQNPFTQISGVKETVYEEIAYGMENLGFKKARMISRIDQLLHLFDLVDLQDKNPYALSGGQKQRVALASVIALDPQVIILDEPTSQLDPQSTEAIFKIIATLKAQGKTILLVEHKIDLLAQYCDEILLLERGQLVLAGLTQQVLTNPKVLDHGGQLPQITRFYLEAIQDQKLPADQQIPLTVTQAYQQLKEVIA